VQPDTIGRPPPARFAEAGGVAALAALVTGLLAAPVLRAPADRVFGADIVGRHHDPFTVMRQFELGLRGDLYGQPITDLAGTLLARAVGGVAAYNLLVLVTFPLAAAAVYLLARHLTISRASATVAALAFAFSPFHLAHAAYHPHIAQVQWLPLYVLALWRCLDAPTPGGIAVLAGATAAVTLSNFYGGFIAAVLTPIMVAAYWLPRRHAAARPVQRLIITVATLLVLSVVGAAYAWWSAPALLAEGSALAFSRDDLFRYSAKWWSYLVPPVTHPLLGPAAARIWEAERVQLGLLEQQVSLGWAFVVLGIVALAGWWTRTGPAAISRVPALAIIATAALLCSLSPERVIGDFTFVRPSALFYEWLPMFRSYARFGMAVQLMAALLAGIGIDVLWQLRGRLARPVCAVLVALAAAEYAVAPSALSRDVLPTTAHRWVMRQPGPMRVFDCAPLTLEASSVSWLTGARIVAGADPVSNCGEPDIAQKLAGDDFTHVLVRSTRGRGTPAMPTSLPAGLRAEYAAADGQVLAVTVPRPALYTASLAGFSARERDADWSWRWMGATGAWMVRNTTPQAVAATLDIELLAFHRQRQVTVLLDQQPVQVVAVAPARERYRIGPFPIAPGFHELRFTAVEPATVAREVIDNGDRRPLSIAVGSWSWSTGGSPP
jgi:hypothetical protein